MSRLDPRTAKMNKSTEMNKLIVISGCSGGGKSTLLSELSSNGYTVIAEIGREIVKEQLAVKGNITPWQNTKEFCEILITRSIVAFNQAKKTTTAKEHLIFFDRSILEGISYYQSLKTKDAHKYDQYIEDLRYYPIIFMTPPWREIYCQDEERKHSFEDAVDEYTRLLKSYPEYGYRIIELPKLNVKARIQFLLSSIS